MTVFPLKACVIIRSFSSHPGPTENLYFICNGSLSNVTGSTTMMSFVGAPVEYSNDVPLEYLHGNVNPRRGHSLRSSPIILLREQRHIIVLMVAGLFPWIGDRLFAAP